MKMASPGSLLGSSTAKKQMGKQRSKPVVLTTEEHCCHSAMQETLEYETDKNGLAV